MKQLGILTLYILLGGSVMMGQAPLSLQECRTKAIKNSEILQIAQRQEEAATHTRKATQAKNLPKISLEGYAVASENPYSYTLKGGYLPNFKPNLATGGLEPDFVIGPGGKPVMGPDGNPVFNNYALMPDQEFELDMNGMVTGMVKVEQPLYMGGKISAACKMAKIGETLTQEQVRMKKAELILLADKTYWQLVAVDQKVSLAEKYVKMVAALKEQLANSYEMEMVSKNDLLKATVAYNKALLSLQKARHGRDLARMDLCRVIGDPLDQLILPTDSIPLLKLPQLAGEEWKDISSRPEYQILDGQIALNEKKEALVQSDFLPQIGMMGSYSVVTGMELNGGDVTSDGLGAMVSVKIPLFQWGEARHKKKVAKLETQQQRLTRDYQAERMRLEARQASYNLLDAYQECLLTQQALEQAEENMRVSKDHYDLGMETLTNLLEAQTQWQEAYATNIEAQSGFKVQETAYDKALGKTDLTGF